MPSNFNTYARLESRPYERNLEEGFAAAIHDPLWFLARQWQMGEHQGENASSPVWVNYTLSSHPIQSADPRFDPLVIPAEAIVESERDDWWTMGRRMRIGRRVATHMALPEDDALRFYNPPPPYEQFHHHFDGLALWHKRDVLGIAPAVFGEEIPSESTPTWVSEKLLYQQSEQNSFATDQHKLTVQRHRGGRMDWHSVDASVAPAPDPRSETKPGEAIPTTLHYPGAPSTRWWQIEDAEIDPGGYAPDSAHTPTALLTELIFSHSDDWFLFPIVARAGHVVAIETLEVHDAFGRVYRSQDVDGAGQRLWQGLHPPQQWTLFHVDGRTPEEQGLPPEALLIWHVAELPLESIALERVQFGLDEESNLLWAVERTVDGREIESRKVDVPNEDLHPKFNNGKPSGDARQEREYAYVPGQGMTLHWHPYQIDEVEVAGQAERQRRLVQRRLVDLSRQKPMPLPGPEAQVLQADSPNAPHQIAPLAIPSNGIELERRWQLARDMNGVPVLWVQRQRRTLLSPPARLLRFDVMEEATTQ